MEALLGIMLLCRDRAAEQLRLYEKNSDECKLENEREFTFTEGWVEALNYMIETAESLLYGDDEEDI